MARPSHISKTPFCIRNRALKHTRNTHMAKLVIIVTSTIFREPKTSITPTTSLDHQARRSLLMRIIIICRLLRLYTRQKLSLAFKIT